MAQPLEDFVREALGRGLSREDIVRGLEQGGWSGKEIQTALDAGVRRRFAPHQLRHAHAVEMAREGVPLVVIQRQLGTPTSGSLRSTCRASTTPKSSTPCPAWV